MTDKVFKDVVSLLENDPHFQLRVLQNVIDKLEQKYNIPRKELIIIIKEQIEYTKNDLFNYLKKGD